MYVIALILVYPREDLETWGTRAPLLAPAPHEAPFLSTSKEPVKEVGIQANILENRWVDTRELPQCLNIISDRPPVRTTVPHAS